MNIAEIIRETVSMRDICNQYGFTPNRAGFISCPFHTGDNTASLKIYHNNRGWHCFGCGQGGSVIDFVERLFNTDFNGAVRIINDDFKLDIPFGNKPNYHDRAKFKQRCNEIEQERIRRSEQRKKEQEEYDQLINDYVCLDLIIQTLKPHSPDDELDDNYVMAMHKMPIIEFRLDCIKG